MGSAAAASNPKKKSGEDRHRRKNPKSLKRRRVSSPSSYSSDPDDVHRRRRISRRKTEKRRGRDLKRSVKMKSRKARHRSVSSASRDSSSSCSTCRSRSSGSLDRSRSPVRRRADKKGKFKKVKRGRKLNRVVRSSRIKNSSLSCFISSGCSSPSRAHSYREEKSKERDGSRQIGSSSIIESREEVEERYGSGGRETDEMLIGNGSGGRETDEMLIGNCDDSRLPRANVGCDVDRVEENMVMHERSYERGAEIDRWMSESNVDSDSYFDQFEDIGAQTSEPYKELELNTKLSRRIKSEIVAPDKYDYESDDLELMLRQKALENLKKLRGRLLSDNRATDDRRIESAGDESSGKACETAKILISSSESHSIVSKESHVQVGVPSHDLKVNPVIELPSKEPNYSTSDNKTIFSRLNQSRNSRQLGSSISGQSTSNQLNDMEVSPEKMPHKQSPCRGSQEKNASAGCVSGNSFRPEANLGDGLASGNTCPNGKEKTCETSETVDECQGGSQFEQKTFSRMHDGEMVQSKKIKEMELWLQYVVEEL